MRKSVRRQRSFPCRQKLFISKLIDIYTVGVIFKTWWHREWVVMNGLLLEQELGYQYTCPLTTPVNAQGTIRMSGKKVIGGLFFFTEKYVER